MVLGIYDGQLHVSAGFDDFVWKAVCKKSSAADKSSVWLPHENVKAEYGHMELCASLFWQALVSDGLRDASGNGFLHGAALWQGDRKSVV